MTIHSINEITARILTNLTICSDKHNDELKKVISEDISHFRLLLTLLRVQLSTLLVMKQEWMVEELLQGLNTDNMDSVIIELTLRHYK